jgi:hypothetical protein
MIMSDDAGISTVKTAASTAAVPAMGGSPATVGTLILTGTPFGGWEGLATVALNALGSQAWRDEVFERWHEQQVGDPLALVYAPSAWALDQLALQRLVESAGAADGVEASGRLRVGLDPRATWTLPAWMHALPTARALVWVESPAHMLATLLGRDGQFDVEAALNVWCTAAQAVLQAQQASGGRVRLVEVTEAALAPQAMLQQLPLAPLQGTRFASSLVALPSAQALCLARGLIDDDHPALTWYARLKAACVRLNGVPAMQQATLSCLGGVSVQAAVDAYKAGERASQRLAPLEAEVEALRPLVREAAVAGDLRLALERTQREQQLLQTQSEQMLEELEYLSLKLRAASATGPSGGLTSRYAWGPFNFALPRDTPPHRELGFTTTVSGGAGGAAASSVEARLVDHHGRAGLVIFADRGAEPLSTWLEAGAEAGRSFMVLIPEDQAGRDWLMSCSSGDWHWVQELAQVLARALVEQAQAAFWIRTAARLQQQCQALPAVFRHDGVALSAQAPGGEGDAGWHMTFRAPSCGAWAAEQLTVCWRPGVVAGQDVWVLEKGLAERVPPLASWPLARDDLAPAQWQLPLAGAAAPAALCAAWAEIEPGDAQTLRALFQALPAVFRSPQFAALQVPWSGAALEQRLQAAWRDGQRVLRGPMWRRAARVLRAWMGR